MNIKAAYQYVLGNICKSIIVYYIILIVCYLLSFSPFLFSSTHNTQYDSMNRIVSHTVIHSELSGMEFITVIFIFIMGYYALRNNFGPLIQNSISRKTIFINEGLVSLTFTLILTSISELLLIITKIVASVVSVPNNTIECSSLYENIYNLEDVSFGGIFFHITNYLYNYFLFLFFMITGFLFSLIYYRISRIVKIILNVCILSVVLMYQQIVERMSNTRLKEAVSDFADAIFGISSNQPAFAMITFLILSAIVAYFIWLLLRRANVREY